MPAPKKATTKKTTTKRVVKKTAPAVEAKPAVVVQSDTHECKCGSNCPCHGGGCGFCRVIKKIVILLVVFALGFAVAKVCCGPKHHGPRAHFVNGCMDITKVQNPKVLESLPAMDINQDGCITREEFRHAKRHMRNEIQENAPQIPDEEVTE